MRPTLQPLQPTLDASPSHALPVRSGRRVRLALVAALVAATAAFATLASVPSTAPAATLASKQAQARALDEQVNRLERRYDDLLERYRGAQYELDEIRKDVDRAHRIVVATRQDLGSAKVRLAGRASAIYRTGGAGNEITELVSAGSFADFFARIDTMNRVGDQDANVLVAVERLNAQVERKERILRAAKVRAAKAAARAKADKEAMGELLERRAAKLASVNSDIRAIMDAQRREAMARAAAAARESAALASPRAGGTGDSAAQGGDVSATPAPSSSSSTSGGGSASVPLPPGSGSAAAAASAAMTRLGMPYVWAASGPSSFDCSGLVVWAFAQAGRPGLPHSTYSLINMGVEVPMDQLQVGDLVFSGSLGHMGIYVGNNSFVHAPRSGDVVKVTSFSDYQLQRARRI